MHLDVDVRAVSSFHRKAAKKATGTTPHAHCQERIILDNEPEGEIGLEGGMQDLLQDFFGDVLPEEAVAEAGHVKASRVAREREIKDTCNEMLYKGAKVSKIRTLLALMNLQSVYGWSDASVTTLFELLHKLLPPGNSMSQSRRDAKRVLSTVGLDYECIHACPNDCVLFRGELAEVDACPKCKSHRYRQDLQGTKVPCKILRHFPLIPRVRHMFRCKGIAQLMTWQANSASRDGKMRVPADSPAWKHIDEKWPVFSKEPQNLRFGLAADRVNPFGLRSRSWSSCFVNYNIPPWLAIKKGHLLLSLLIPGKHKVKNFDVYMQPLIEELNEL